jgi:hypothetical protein
LYWLWALYINVIEMGHFPHAWRNRYPCIVCIFNRKLLLGLGQRPVV